MNSRKTICCLSAAAAIGGMTLSMAALSEQTPARGSVAFSVYDQNGDGFVSKDEFNAVREKLKAEGRPMRNARSFADLDLNHDEKISEAEFSSAHQMQMGRQGRAAGGRQGSMPSFSEFDLNKDGKITEDEFTDARTARITKRLQEGYQMRGLANAPSFEDIDTNHDKAISPEEFAAQLAEHQKQMRP
jgi:Ca2+-binding EF-hand superfamily protein